MRRRTVVSGATLTVLLVVLAGMTFYGFRAATAPFGSSASSPEECSDDERQVQRFVTRGDVQVSVLNAGTTSGLAGRTIDRFEALGFVPGDVGNAPPRVEVRRALVRTTETDDTAARLVARTLGRGTRIEVTSQDLGPGVDVIVGNRLGNRFGQGSPARLRLPEPIEQCISVD